MGGFSVEKNKSFLVTSLGINIANEWGMLCATSIYKKEA
jgi:hypothetical protein